MQLCRSSSASGVHQPLLPADALLLMQIVETTVKGSSKKIDSMGQLIEAVLGQDLAHPNVVQTYKHITRVAPQVRYVGWLKLLARLLLSVSLQAAPAPAPTAAAAAAPCHSGACSPGLSRS